MEPNGRKELSKKCHYRAGSMGEPPGRASTALPARTPDPYSIIIAIKDISTVDVSTYSQAKRATFFVGRCKSTA
jgi:hypothetical protein